VRFQPEAGPFCELRAIHAPHWSRARHLGGIWREDACDYARSTYYGDRGQALRDLAAVMRDVLGPKAQEVRPHTSEQSRPSALHGDVDESS
jgi:hypothetical protein